jgi:hypothetical protein
VAKRVGGKPKKNRLNNTYMDPIKEGTKIFNKVAKQLGKDIITDLKEFESFLTLLKKETKGWVIFDFLDAGNWDCFESFEIDHSAGLVYINWHDYRKITEEDVEKELRSMVFPANVYGLCLQFQELRVIKIRDITFFTFRGFALSTKDVEKIMKQNSSQFKNLDNTDNFSIQTIRQVGEEWHDYDFLNTPIYSTLILPKNISLSASQSKGLLFNYNLWHCSQRINKAEIEINLNITDTDLICEKANTLRRTMESILKIECCYRSEQISVKKSYSELLLGDLIKLIKDFRSDEEKLKLNSIVRLSNELSHDSGKLVNKEKAFELVELVKQYCENLDIEIHTNPDPHFNW